VNQLFIKVLPLSLASAVSPATLAVSLVLLGAKSHPRLKAFAYLLGGAVVAGMLTVLGLLLAGGESTSDVPHSHAVIDIVLGAILAVLGIVALAVKPRKDGGALSRLDSKPPRRQIAACGMMGLLAMGLNVSSQVPFIAAVREVGRSAVSVSLKAVALGIACVLLLLPMILPLAMYLVASGAAARILTPVSAAATKYGRYVIAAICLIIGAVFIRDGVAKL